MRQDVYWVAEHPEVKVGITVSDVEVLDGLPSPRCPLNASFCPEGGHLMRPVTKAEYEALMGDEEEQDAVGIYLPPDETGKDHRGDRGEPHAR